MGDAIPSTAGVVFCLTPLQISEIFTVLRFQGSNKHDDKKQYARMSFCSQTHPVPSMGANHLERLLSSNSGFRRKRPGKSRLDAPITNLIVPPDSRTNVSLFTDCPEDHPALLESADFDAHAKQSYLAEFCPHRNTQGHEVARDLFHFFHGGLSDIDRRARDLCARLICRALLNLQPVTV